MDLPSRRARFEGRLQPLLTRLTLLLALLVSAPFVRAQGSFSAKNVINGEVRPILDCGGNPLSALTGRVEILADDGRILASGKLTRDGVFFLGVVQHPSATSSMALITVRAWDTAWANSYAEAMRYGMGFGSSTDFAVSLSIGTSPPSEMEAFQSFRLHGQGFLGLETGQFVASNRVGGTLRPILDSSGSLLPADHGQVELFTDGRLVLSRPLTGPGAFDFGVVEAYCTIVTQGICTLAGTCGTVTLRAWDTRTGTSYVNATSRAEESFPAYYGLEFPAIHSSAPELVQMKSLTLRDLQPTIPAATFSASNLGIQEAAWVLDPAGNPYPKTSGRVDLMWKNAVVASGPLSVDGGFDLGRISLPGTAPGEVVDLLLRGWDIGPSGKDGFDSALVRGTNIFSVRLRAVDEVPGGGPVQFYGFQLQKSSQSIQFAPLVDVTDGELPLHLVASASSGLPVSFAVSSGPARLNVNGTLQLLSPGRVTVTASQAGNAYYAPVSVTQSFTIIPAPRNARLNVSTNGWRFSFRGDADRMHLVESATTVQGPWKEVARAVGNDLDHPVEVQLPASSEAVKFYRVRLP